MDRLFRHLPNTITLLNLVAGLIAIICALEGDPGVTGIFILFACVLDFLDGFTARALKAYSDLGKQLDSLADVVSFGVAPSMIAFALMKEAVPGVNLPLTEISASIWYWILLFSPFMIPVFSALRLARFNIDERQKENFLGMPTPANAILWASFGLIFQFTKYPEVSLLLFTSRNLLIAAIITSLLLVSELPMFSLKFSGLSLSGNWYRYLFLLISVILMIFLKLYGLPVIVLLYIALSVLFYLLKINY